MREALPADLNLIFAPVAVPSPASNAPPTAAQPIAQSLLPVASPIGARRDSKSCS